MKKKMLNKVLASVLAGAMAVSMLTGCGSNGNTNSSSQAASTQESKAEESKAEESKTEEAAASTEEEATIKIAAWDASSSATTNALIEGFEKAHPNIKVELIDIASADYTQKLSVMLNGGNDLDVVWIKDADTTPTLAGRGQLEDLTPYIERDGVDLNMYNGLAEPMNMDGKQVAVPTNTSYYILYYNKDIFDYMKI